MEFIEYKNYGLWTFHGHKETTSLLGHQCEPVDWFLLFIRM